MSLQEPEYSDFHSESYIAQDTESHTPKKVKGPPIQYSYLVIRTAESSSLQFCLYNIIVQEI